ncbi:MAG: haloacid dehalogenase type II [Betaproteobacteria bacterium]|nr:haloacid dehalogenase type II [Betaproteobacteria bacterium]
MVPKLNAMVFDAYGTLYDVHSVIAQCNAVWTERGQAVSQLWRAKQLEWTWQRSLMGRYVDFRELTLAALRYTTEALKLPCSDDTALRLLKAYEHLEPFPEARDALEALRPVTMAILSNGSPNLLEPLVTNSGLDRWITDVISVDALRVYKPTPRVYQLAVDRLELPPEEIGFVSSNCWDACGAKAFGFHVFWINRTGAPVDALGAPPDHIMHSLAELPRLISR